VPITRLCLPFSPSDLFEPRLYRATLLLGFAAAAVLMFSVVSRPEALRSGTAADAFKGETAATLTRQLVRIAPDRAPGSRDDGAAAAFVAERFRAIAGGQVLEQRFGGQFDGDAVQMRNVTLVLPGTSSQRIVLAAPRDCAGGFCAASSAAATATLLELASAFNGARHAKTLVFVSLDGSAAGAAGARELADALESEPAEAVIVISQAGSAKLERPLVIPWSSGPQSTSIQLIESAKDAVEGQLRKGGTLKLGSVQSLLRLAIPVGLGDQAPLIERGADAVAVSSTGERYLPESEDDPADISARTLAVVGRSVLSLSFALDEHEGTLSHGPSAYVPLAGKLIPGWSLALLAFTLLLPVGVVSVDALARSARHGEPALLALVWVLSRVIPFAAAILAAYLMALIGVMPEPDFPFDPARHTLGVGALLTIAALALIFVAGLRLSRLLVLPEDAEEVLAPAVGAMVFASILGIWFANPFLALLLVPGAHLWLFASLLRGRLGPALILIAAGLVLPLVAVLFVASQIGAGVSAPWELLLMLTGRHFGPLAVVPLCLLGGCLLALLTIAATPPGTSPARPRRARGRGGLIYAGPGSLGGTGSTLPKY
jgi:hypothetical protein